MSGFWIDRTWRSYPWMVKLARGGLGETWPLHGSRPCMYVEQLDTLDGGWQLATISPGGAGQRPATRGERREHLELAVRVGQELGASRTERGRPGPSRDGTQSAAAQKWKATRDGRSRRRSVAQSARHLAWPGTPDGSRTGRVGAVGPGEEPASPADSPSLSFISLLFSSYLLNRGIFS
jgi:hypothetical protein